MRQEHQKSSRIEYSLLRRVPVRYMVKEENARLSASLGSSGFHIALSAVSFDTQTKPRIRRIRAAGLASKSRGVAMLSLDGCTSQNV